MLDDVQPEALINTHIGSYRPEPNEPLAYEYPYAGTWTAYVPELLKQLIAAWEKGDEGMTVELLGLFANLTPLDAVTPSVAGAKVGTPWSMAALCGEAAFMSILSACLLPGKPIAGLGEIVDPTTGQTVQLAAGCSPTDDLLLEAMQLVSALALDAGSSPHLVQAGVPALLADILAVRMQDPDVLMQAIFAVLRLLHHAEARDSIIYSTDIPARAADLLAHPHPGLAAEADDAVTIMIEHDRELGTTGLWRTLQARRYAIHNREWLHVIDGGLTGRGGACGDEEEDGVGEGGLPTLRQGGRGQVPITGEAPDAYVNQQEDSYGHDDDLDKTAAAQVAGLDGSGGGGAGGAGSPLHKLGKHTEQVAFDVSYLYNQQGNAGAVGSAQAASHGGHPSEGGGGGRRQRSPSEIFDYAEMAMVLEGEEGGEGEDEEDEGSDGGTLPEDARQLMAQYMGRR